MPHTETMLESKEIFNGRVIRVTLHRPPGERQHQHPGDRPPSRRRLCAAGGRRRQCLYGPSVPLRHGRGNLELPAGKLEAGEDPFEAAKRELGEECGVTADHFIDLGVVYATVGYDSEKIYLWAATGPHPVGQHLDEDEFLDVVKMPFEKALAWCWMAPSGIPRPRWV